MALLDELLEPEPSLMAVGDAVRHAERELLLRSIGNDVGDVE